MFRELVERPTFRVRLSGGDDPGVFVEGDGATFAVPHGGPLALGDDRSRQPAHVQCEVVDAAQVHIRGDLAISMVRRRCSGAGLDEWELEKFRDLALSWAAMRQRRWGFAVLLTEDGFEDVPLVRVGGVGIMAIMYARAIWDWRRGTAWASLRP